MCIIVVFCEAYLWTKQGAQNYAKYGLESVPAVGAEVSDAQWGILSAQGIDADKLVQHDELRKASR